jgi:hypothetical protein
VLGTLWVELLRLSLQFWTGLWETSRRLHPCASHQYLAEIGDKYEVDPILDLRPVCPTCDAVIHLGRKTRDIKDVKVLLETSPQAQPKAATAIGTLRFLGVQRQRRTDAGGGFSAVATTRDHRKIHHHQAAQGPACAEKPGLNTAGFAVVVFSQLKGIAQ